ncbi:MAG: PAS domain S-box protein [Rhizobacter sp.]|nr:PAS domain S-box protein [Ferruginibacter sp.]
MPGTLKILIAEHDLHDLEMIETELRRGDVEFVSENVENESAYRAALKNFIPDIILCDYSFPSFDGPAAFKIREEIAPATPFILVSGTIGEENSIELIKNGVTDFVLKDKMFTLNTKLIRALKESKERKERCKTEQELKQSEARLNKAQAIAGIGSWETNLSDLEVKWSDETYNIFGVDRRKFQVTHAAFLQLIHHDDIEKVNAAFQTSFSSRSVNSIEHRVLTPSGLLKHIEECWQIFFDDHGTPLTAVGTCQDITERKKNEAAINKAYVEKNMVLESIDDGFFASDKNSLVTYWNRKAEILLGVRKEDMVGKNFHEVFSDSRSAVFYENYQKAARENSTVHFEGFSHRTGKWFAVSAFASDNGLSVYFKDVTERKNGEEKLKESELRYRSIIEQATDAICIADASLKIMDINDYGCRMLGYSKAEFLQLTVNDLFLAEDLETNPFKMEELRSGKVIRNERRFKNKDGKLIDVEMSGRILADGRFIVFGHDIAGRKKAQDKIKESELRYRLLNEQATDAICITNANLNFIDINPYGCETFGYTREEALHLSLPDILFEEDLADNPLGLEGLQVGTTIRNERRLRKKDGTTIHMEVSTRILEDGRLIMFGHDITERKKTEEKVRKANRLYTFISQVNQNIVHIKDEESLFRNACQVAYEFGKFKISWIGLVDETTETIKLVDQNGIAGEDLPLFINTPYLKGGPVDHVLRTGTYYLSNNIQQDLELPNWQPFAQKYGICSVLALPVRRSGKIIGTFNLYAAEHNFFDKEEIDLLADATEDISFALDLFEKAKKQKETEALVIKNERRFRALIDKSVDMKALLGPDGKISYGSSSITKFLGYSPDEFVGENAFDFIHPADILSPEIMQDLLETPGKSQYVQQRLLHKNGDWIWCDGTLTNLLDEPGVNALVSNFRDISETKIIEEQREFERSVKEALINTTDDFMWSVSCDFKLMAANAAFTNYIKSFDGPALMPGDELLIKEIFPAGYLATWEALYNDALKGESLVKEMYNPPTENHREQWFETTLNPICNSNKVTGIACYSRDITGRKQSEIRLKELNENLQKQAKELVLSNAELEQFAYVASHDLQEPLRMVTSFLTLLEKKYGAVIDDKGKQYIEFAVDGAKRMRQIILDLLGFSRVGRMDDEAGNIDLNELLNEITILFRKQIAEKEGVIISDPLPHVPGFRSPIRQVLQNLVGNALKFSVKGRAVQINIKCIAFNDHWQFAVSDNGIGINQEYFDKIFIIFQRLHNRNEFSGTGMGLAITKKIIENQGGKIWVESEEGKGSTFYFTLIKH